MAKAMGSGGHRTVMIVSGLLMVVLGAMWWMGKLDINKALSALLVLWGLKKLYWASQGECC